jgi:hypothetical protein
LSYKLNAVKKSLINGWILENPVLKTERTADIICLTPESIQGLSLTLQGVDNVHGGDSLPPGVLSVGDRVPDDVLKEDLEHTTGLLVDETGDTLDTATTSETTDGGLGDALDVVTEDLPVTLGASLSESFSSFTAA